MTILMDVLSFVPSLFDAGIGSLLAQSGESDGISGTQIVSLLVALAVLILPFVLGGFLAKRLKMPTHSIRIGFVLFAITACVAVLLNRLPGLGVDLRGGTILVYEIDPSKSNPDSEGAQIKSQALVGPLTKRINPSGTQEIVIRPYGDTQIEIIIPEVDQREVAVIEDKLEKAGILRFAIVANRTDHMPIIDLATDQAGLESQTERLRTTVQDPSGRVVGRWVVLDQEAAEDANDENEVRAFRVSAGGATVRNPRTGELVELPFDVQGRNGEFLQAKWCLENDIPGLEILMVINPDLEVTGEDLAFASNSFDRQGAPAVSFNLTDSGSGKFRVLTTENLPQGNRSRLLGIVMDDRLLSAPSINEAISKQGQITGNFTRQEVQSLVDILKAGQLPAALSKKPIAKNQIDATLGKDTIRKGVIAIGASLTLVLLFILVYYRFAGMIAVLALVLNLAMILATMVLINQPLTLPGLAGLVLTVGMSVDANVLIFERIREEIKKGAKNRMAIRNGFGKAT
ncbi:MAG: protein translocase subunit SecD, partial [Planctomycetota bacterium]